MKYLTPVIFLFCSELLVPDTSLAQTKFMGKPVAQEYKIWIGGWWGDLLGQDAQGSIYLLQLGESKLLIFNSRGISETYSVPESRIDGAIYVAPSGRIYVGGTDLGYYFPGPDGRYVYHSLNHLLPPDHQISYPKTIRRIFAYGDEIVFAKVDAFYFYGNDTIRIVPTGNYLGHETIQFKGDLYNGTGGEGLCVLRNGAWELLPFGSFFKNKIIIEILEYSHDKMLVCTLRHGLFLMDKDKITSFAEKAIAYDQVEILSAYGLSDGSFALGSIDHGLYILNPSGELIYHFNAENILKPSNPISEILQDSFGNIWLRRPLGTFMLKWNSPFSILDQTVGLDGYGFSVYTKENQLYLGTSRGLFVGENKWPIDRLSKVEEISGIIHLMQSFDGDMLLAGDRGLYQLTDAGYERVSDIGGWWSWHKTKNPKIVIGGTWHGIYRLEKADGLWSVSGRYETEVTLEPKFQLDEEDRVWGKVWPASIYSISFTDDYQKIASITEYDSTKGLPPNIYRSEIMKLNDQVVISTSSGIYEYNENEAMFRPSDVWNERFGMFGASISSWAIDSSGNIYYLNRGSQIPKRLTRDNWDRYTNEPDIMKEIPIDKTGTNGISILNDKNILVGYNEGFIHYDAAAPAKKANDIKLKIRYVKLTRSDSLVFGGYFTLNDELVLSQPSGDHPQIPYKENSLIIGYAAVEFNNFSQTYRYQLEGYDEDWSPWTTDTEKEYMNLWEGEYTFKIEAQDVTGGILPMQTYRFTILPPWYRTVYAYGGYVMVAIGVFGFVFMYYRGRKEREITRLKIQHTAAEIYHKQSQLATTAMHLIEKTDFISFIKTRINEILIQENKNVSRELRRIIKEIDRNIQRKDIWEVFEQHFDVVHAGFLQKLQKDFPRLTPQELKLSAYLRMNLNTKEIANLLQITPRSVEVARYRLRKKLNLNIEQNLVSFMMNY